MAFKPVIQLMRPGQWMKNFFVCLPLFFDQRLFQKEYWAPVILTFFSFCFIASSIYCLNDIIDVERDRVHPKKKFRPIASGVISKATALIIMILCILISFLLAFSVGHDSLRVAAIIFTYLVLNIAYSFKLKQYAIIDVFIIAIGFALRVLAGAFCCDIIPSNWLVLMTFLLALFLAFAKRRDDVVIYQTDGILARNNIVRYNLPFLNQVIGLIAAITMICYIMYTITPEVISRFHTRYVYLTSIFVLAGIIKYLQITMVDVKSGNPTKVLLKNRFIQLCILGWILSFFLIIYL